MHFNLRDLKFAVRSISRNKLLAVAAALTLAIGIGVNTAIFSGVYAYLKTPLGYAHPERLVWLAESHGGKTAQFGAVSWRDAEDWKHAAALESLVLFRFEQMRIGTGGAQSVKCVDATFDLFAVLGAKPQLGRLPESSDTDFSRSIVVSDGFWHREFGGMSSIIGQILDLNGQQFTVAAVLYPDFDFLYSHPDVFLPLEAPPSDSNRRDNRVYSVIGRIRPQATVRQLQTEITSISSRLEEESPETNLGWDAYATTLEDFLIPRNARVGAATALAAVSLVLFIACANVASLLLSRGVARRKELAIRATLGATGNDLRLLLFWDSLLLAFGGGIIGVAVAYVGIPVLKSIVPPGTPRISAMQLNVSALLYTALDSLIAGILSGIAPMWSVNREKPMEVIQSGGRGTATNNQRIFRAIVIVQITVVMVLLMAAGLLIRSLQRQLDASPGFDKEDLLLARIALPEQKYSSPVRTATYYRELVASVSKQSNIKHVTASDVLPVGPCSSLVSIRIEGRSNDDPRKGVTACRFRVEPKVLRTLGIRLLKGREITFRDGLDQPRAAVVNETMARKFNIDLDYVTGHRFSLGHGDWITVVGIAADVRPEGTAWRPTPTIYLSAEQFPSATMTIIARTNGKVSVLGAKVRKLALDLEREAQIDAVESLESWLTQRMASSTAIAKIIGYLSAAGICLLLIGIYGVSAYAMAQRLREIGLRMALGADRIDIFRTTLAQTSGMILSGLFIGLPLAYAVTPLLRSLLIGITPYDWVTGLSVACTMLCVGFAACSIPAWRATQIDPAECLRME